MPSVRIGRLPSRCVTCRPGLSVRTVRRLCHSPRAAFSAVSGGSRPRVATSSRCPGFSACFALRAGIQGFEPWTSVPRGNGFHTVHRLTHLSWVFLGDSALMGPFSAFQGLTGSTLQRISPPLPSRSCRTARADAGASRYLSVVLQRSKRLAALFPFRPQAFCPSTAPPAGHCCLLGLSSIAAFQFRAAFGPPVNEIGRAHV